ncbi:hypothetical protein [Streptomyces sp. NPDC056323]|uniref:hypothetical protein n=1 Tax=Streptomyces sp. NPDC056323 TaxID=3345784 RepID=UPI0035E1A160
MHPCTRGLDSGRLAIEAAYLHDACLCMDKNQETPSSADILAYGRLAAGRLAAGRPERIFAG